MFYKKQYKDIAANLKWLFESPDPIQSVDIVAALAVLFQEDNPNFDERKFGEACGLSWEEYCLAFK